ncbi:TLL1 [Branchiostoma lanceolatum]|uniref:Metalloendopeptidase n=2 Tax=Branchiostoma lanceolatum TaxID=7740 RepID=A0A8J9W5K0_BRALA|nr:TLL1 [Branchiostoma lanceolatum]
MTLWRFVCVIVVMTTATWDRCQAQDPDDDTMGAFERILKVNKEAESLSPPIGQAPFEGDIAIMPWQQQAIQAQLQNQRAGDLAANAVAALETLRWPKGIIPYTIDCSLRPCRHPHSRTSRAAIPPTVAGLSMRWPKGIIPFTIDCSLQNIPAALTAIKTAMRQWEERTCIRFVQRTTEEDYVDFYRSKYCQCPVGRVGGRQRLSVGNGCEFTHVMIHEIGHAIGFWHEQSRPDRDNWVEVLWDNIEPGLDVAFDKYGKAEIDSLGVDYDYGSIMHYPFNAFPRSPGLETLRALQKVTQQPYKQLSEKDVLQVQLMYDYCKERTDSDLPPDANDPVCDDLDASCASWAAAGECENNINWMLYHCKHSCNTCDGPCEDSEARCPQWAREGECVDNAEYMLLNCRKSCRSCRLPGQQTHSPPAAEGLLMRPSFGPENLPEEARPPAVQSGIAMRGETNEHNVAALLGRPIAEREKKWLRPYLVIRNACIRSRNQLGTFRDQSLRLCVRRCNDDDRCASFDYIPSYRSCYLSLDNRESAPHDFDGCLEEYRRITNYYEKRSTTSGRDRNPESDVPDGYGVIRNTCIKGRNQLGNFYGETLEQCVSRCSADVRCKSFDFVMTYQSCHLSTDDRVSAGEDALCSPEYSKITNYYEKIPEDAPSIGDFLRINEGCILGRNQLGSFYDETVEQCQGRCGNDYSCRSFDYVHTYRSCHLSTDNRVTARAAFEECPSWLRLQTDYYEKVTEPPPTTRPPPTTTARRTTTTWRPPTRTTTKSPLPESCSTPLGLGKQSGYTLPDAAFTASSTLSLSAWSAGPENARLHQEDDYDRKRVGAWCASSSDYGEYLQVDLGRTKRITGVATQGRHRQFEHVKSYNLAFSHDSRTWYDYMEGGYKKTFEGNCDHLTAVTNGVAEPLTARFLRFIVQDNEWPCLRAEVYGCEPDNPTQGGSYPDNGDGRVPDTTYPSNGGGRVPETTYPSYNGDHGYDDYDIYDDDDIESRIP